MNPNSINLRWEQTDAGDDPNPDGMIVCGTEGCSDYRVIAQCVSRVMGEMIVRDVVARDILLCACKEALKALNPLPGHLPQRTRLTEAITLAEYPMWLTALAQKEGM